MKECNISSEDLLCNKSGKKNTQVASEEKKSSSFWTHLSVFIFMFSAKRKICQKKKTILRQSFKWRG